ncbi:MAG: hypothetical protein HQK77_18340, partial [Desulfobacterales bacterium]|nr:hypothetical protein [Desulfobacterales bacterium]
GYWGFKKRKIEAEFNKKYGDNNWSIGHYGENVILSYVRLSLSLYEISYVHFLKNNPEILRWLCSSFKDVYDYSPKNTRCQFSYDMQNESANHYQDIAVRRAIRYLGYSFQGNELLQIRGKDSSGYILNPGKIPFFAPRLIKQPEMFSSEDNPRIWWDKGSIESFWQNNKILLYRNL